MTTARPWIAFRLADLPVPEILAAAPELWDQLNPDHDEYLLLDGMTFVT